MNIAEVYVAIIQDDLQYIRRFQRNVKNIRGLFPAYTLQEGIVLINQIASGTIPAHLIALDENLTPGIYDGSNGQVLYAHCQETGLADVIPIVSISSDPKLPIFHVASYLDLVAYIENL